MEQEIEIWKDFTMFGNGWAISSFGKIKRTYTTTKTGKQRMLVGNILKTFVNDRGYECVKFVYRDESGECKSKRPTIHRLVCTHFHDNPENKPQVNHKDCNQLNNHWLNLEWATAKDNTVHAHKNGRSKAHIDKIKKVTPEHEKFIIDNYGKIKTEEIAKILGVSVGITLKWAIRNGIDTSVPHAKKVINTANNQIFKSTLDAAKSIGFPKRRLQRMLSGERPNQTSFKYA